MKELILDMDSSVSETYGEQEGSAYNGHYACTCYHPLFCFNQIGDVEGVLLREGNAHSAKDWQTVLDPIVARYRGKEIDCYFRGDAAFAACRFVIDELKTRLPIWKKEIYSDGRKHWIGS
jgi:hypothetical protein